MHFNLYLRCTQSNKNGKFTFPAMYQEEILSSFFSSILPHQPVVLQNIDIYHDGKSYEAYKLRKGDYKIDTEFDGKKIKLECDLDKEASHEEDVYGVCVFVGRK